MHPFAIVDCNNFYVSCERLFDPKLRGVPVVVLSNNDGCVISRSNEAKKLGVPMTAPEFKWRDFFKLHNVQVLSSNYELYGDMSNRVYRALKAFSPAIEKYSIDESFLYLPDVIDGHKLKQEIYRCVGIPVSVGVGATKTLAKAANQLAKDYSGYNGVFYMPEEPVQDNVLRKIPVKKLWGIGPRWAKTLTDYGIVSVYDFKHSPDTWIKRHMNVVALRLAHELRGTSCLGLEEVASDRKHAMCTQSFGRTVETLEDLNEAVSSFASTAAARLRGSSQVASLVRVFVRSGRYGSGPRFHDAHETVLPEPTASGPAIVKTALEGLKQIYVQGLRYKKAGVILSGLEKDSAVQIDLFNARDKKKDASLMQAYDQINIRYGRGSVKLGSEGTQQTWRMKQDHCSPPYTTRLDSLKEVH